jgi:small subunit ribosomal protein S21
MFGAMELDFDLLLEPARASLVRFFKSAAARGRQCRHAAPCRPNQTSSDVGMIGMITASARHRWTRRLSPEKEHHVQVFVRDNNVDQALKALKKKMQREGLFRETKLRGHYEKPSERRVREKAEAIRRARKLAHKKLQREGLLPMKPRVNPGQGRGGPPRAPRF